MSLSGGPSNPSNVNPFTFPPPVTTTITSIKPTELKINPPKPFSGKIDEFDKFLQDVILYLELNNKIYDNNKKIAYTLSFMNEGDAASLRRQYLIEERTLTRLNLMGWLKFQTDLETAFKPYNAPGDALEKITTLKMGNTSIEDHIARYKILITKAGIQKNSPAAIDYFQKSLNIPLQKQLLNLPTPPTTLDKWFEWASCLDNNYWKMLWIFGRTLNNKKEELKGTGTFKRKNKTQMQCMWMLWWSKNTK